MPRGIVKWFDLSKGFGFIEVTSGDEKGTDVFVHAADVEGAPLMEKDEVEFDIGEDARPGVRGGKSLAQRVTGGSGTDRDRIDAKGRGKTAKPGDWFCSKCEFMNFSKRNDCMKCGALKGRSDSRKRGGDRGGSPPRRGRDRADSRRKERSRGRGGRRDSRRR